MKILFLSGGVSPDYLCDSIFHGLRSLYGADVVDFNHAWYMYKSALPNKPHLYGRGFTMFCLLEDIQVDRTDIVQKIKCRHFDLIVYGSAWRYSEFLPLVKSVYPKDRIVLLDGEDHQGLHPERTGSVYFKRECTVDYVNPIGFSIPKEKIVASVPEKNLLVAPLIPGVPSTYIYADEEHYRKDYQRSWFARTKKKAGWDCMRHYEILANGTIPIFEDIHLCPKQTMTLFPKESCRIAAEWFMEGNPIPEIARRDMAAACLQFANQLTTERMAQYVIEKTGVKP